MSRGTWEYTSVLTQDGAGRLVQLLAEGWEPFAVTTAREERVHLRLWKDSPPPRPEDRPHAPNPSEPTRYG